MAGLFDILYEASDEALKAMKKPLVRRKLKRAIQSAFDDAEGRKIKAEETLSTVRKDFENYDINRILGAQAEIIKVEKAQKALKDEFREMFDEEL